MFIHNYIFLSSLSRREKQRMNYDPVSKPKINKTSWEKKDRQTDTNLVLSFCFCPVFLTVLFSFVSGVRLLFGAHPKMGATTSGCLHIIVSGVQLLSLHSCVWQPTDFQNLVPALAFTCGVKGWNISTSGVSTPGQKFWNFCFFISSF